MNGFVDRCYGFGAAHVRLAGEPYARPEAGSWQAALAELRDLEFELTLRRHGVVLVFGLALLALTMAAPQHDGIAASEIEIALFEVPRPVPEPKPQAAIVEPPVATPKPPPPKPEPVVAKPAPVRRARPKPAAPRIDPLQAPAAPAVAPPPFEVARARRAAARRTSKRPVFVAPVSAVAAPIAPTEAPEAAPVRTAARTAPVRSTKRPLVTPRSLALPRIGPSPSSTPAKRAPIAAMASRPDLKPAAARAVTRKDNKLIGVPLGSLASCMSDREEDRLKRRVIAAVGGSAQCESGAGRFRFVETKNLNAFLMWTQRAASRREADRCGELELALDCLKKRSLMEARY